VQVAEGHPDVRIGREPDALALAGQRLGEHPAVAREVVDVG